MHREHGRWTGSVHSRDGPRRRAEDLWCNERVDPASALPVASPSTLVTLVLVLVYLPPALVLAWVDGREHRLPNRWVGSLTGGVALSLLVVAVLVPELRGDLRTAAILALLLGAGAILVALVAPPLLGMGDAKTLPVVVLMSTALGGEVMIAGLLGSALLGGIAGAVVMAVTRRAGVRFAVGPLLLAGPFLGLLGAPLVRLALGSG
jgi:leader peptidase (prepilin peptidase) / N-methyltransferase